MTWTEVDVDELMAFVGLIIAMGVGLPDLNNYWSANTIIQHPWFAAIM